MSEHVSMLDIVKSYLADHGYDGLCGNICGCGVDELVCCDSDPRECVAAHVVTCDPETCPEKGDCEFGPKAGDRCFRPGKRPVEEAKP